MRKNIIITNEIPAINRLWKSGLENEGYEVKIIESSDNIVGYLQENKVDLFVVQLYPSIGKGLELINKIRDTISSGLLLLIVLSQYDRELIESIHSAGCHDYMVMPFWTSELSFRVNRLLL